MQTLKLTIAYDGTRYAGWQRQNGRTSKPVSPPTIQAALEDVFSRLLRERVDVIASGRTDSGVHAEGQVAHLRARRRVAPSAVQRAANQLLPPDIVVTGIRRAPDTFHAQYSARRKRYRYRLRLGAAASPFGRQYAYHVRGPVDIAAMRRAARALRGRHDFAPFQSVGSNGATTVRQVTDVRWVRRPDELWFEIEGTGFLYKMVRRIVGTLLDVGRGVKSPTVIRQILATGDRRWVGPTAPAQGLALVSVQY